MSVKNSKIARNMEDTNYDILIVDDSITITKLLMDIFKLKGFSSKIANDYNSAINELNNNPKIIFLDVNMPDLNGYQFCKMIKSNKKYKEILVYYLTGVSQSEIQINTLLTKADGYIKKPFNISDFNDILDYINH